MLQKSLRATAIAAAVALSALAPAHSAVAAGTLAPRLFVSSPGVALSRFPSHQRLSATVQVTSTDATTSAAWQARSSAAWLTVTASGTTGSTLTIAANPAGLAPDTLHTATVVVQTAAGAAFSDKEKIRVSMWVGATDPAEVDLSQNATAVAANPVLPVFYVADGGPDVRVYNVYSGALVGAFAHVAPSVGSLVPSADGSKLFLVDRTNYRIVSVDAQSGATLATYRLAGPVAADFSFAYARPGGREVLFAVGQPALSVATGKAISAPLASSGWSFSDPLVTASADGSRLAALERGQSPGVIATWSAAFNGSQIVFDTVVGGAWLPGGNCQAMAMNAPGTRVYPACGAPYEFDVFDWATGTQVQTLPAVPYPDNAVIDALGDFVGGVDGIYEPDDVYVYDRKGFQLGMVPTSPANYSGGQAANVMAVSGDASRVITVSNAWSSNPQLLMFRSLP